MNDEKNSAADLIKDLECIYTMAIANKNFAAALKAKELLGREYGLFSLKKGNKVSLSCLSDEDINRLIEEIKIKLGLDHCESGA